LQFISRGLYDKKCEFFTKKRGAAYTRCGLYAEKYGSNQIEAYMQSLTIKKTLESVSLEYRRGGEIATDQIKELKKTEDVSPVVVEKVSVASPSEPEEK
jgi:hypothetical protein